MTPEAAGGQVAPVKELVAEESQNDTLAAILNRTKEAAESQDNSEVNEIWERNADRMVKHGEYRGTVSEMARVCLFIAGIKSPEAAEAIVEQGVREYEESLLEKDLEDPLVGNPPETEPDTIDEKEVSKVQSKSVTEKKTKKVESKTTTKTPKPVSEKPTKSLIETAQEDVIIADSEAVVDNEAGQFEGIQEILEVETPVTIEHEQAEVIEAQQQTLVVGSAETIVPEAAEEKIVIKEAALTDEKKSPKVETSVKPEITKEVGKPAKAIAGNKDIVSKKKSSIAKVARTKPLAVKKPKKAPVPPKSTVEKSKKSETSVVSGTIETKTPTSKPNKHQEKVELAKTEEELPEPIVEAVQKIIEQVPSMEAPDIENVMQKVEVQQLCEEILENIDIGNNTEIENQLKAIVAREIHSYHQELELENIEIPRLDEGTHERKRGMIVRITQSISEFIKNQLHKMLGKSALGQNYQFTT